jgi:MFS family permease
MWRLLLAAGLTLCIWLGLVAVLYNLYLLRLGFDAGAIGLLVGIGSLVWGLAAIPAGLLSNRLGLRNSIVLGIFLYGAGIALTLMVEMQPRPQWQAWLLVCPVVMNIGIAFATVNVPPYMMAVSSEHARPYAFGILAALNPFAALIGSILAGLLPGLLVWLLPGAAAGSDPAAALGAPAPYRLALWLGPLLCAIAILPLLGANSGRVAPGAGSITTTPAAGPGAPIGLLAFWALVVFLVAIGEGAIRTFFNVLLDTRLHASPASIGLTMGLAQFLPIVVGLAVPLLLTRWGSGYTLLSGALALGACLVPFALGGAQVSNGAPPSAAVLWTIGIAYLAAVATFSVIRAGRNMFGQELVLTRWRTSSQGAAMLGLACGLSAAGIVGGRMINAYGFGVLYAFGALATLLGACLLFSYLHQLARRRSDPAIVSS